LAAQQRSWAAREGEVERLVGQLGLTADSLASSHQLAEDLKVQLKELETKQTNDLNAEKELVKQHFDTLTKNFESDKIGLEDSLASKTKEIVDKEAALDQLKNNLSKSEEEINSLNAKAQEQEARISVIKQEMDKREADHSEILKSSKCLKETKVELEGRLEVLSKNTVTIKKHESVRTLLTATIEECDELKERVKKSATDVKQSERKEKTLQTSLARQTKQAAELKEALARHEKEAEAAASNPWEAEDWEGLNRWETKYNGTLVYFKSFSTEIYAFLKNDLVPAQQAR
jgi:chromosome segregation ATPase